jgi:hypothetical protein
MSYQLRKYEASDPKWEDDLYDWRVGRDVKGNGTIPH